MKQCQKCRKEIPGYLKICMDCARESTSVDPRMANLKKFFLWWNVDPEEMQKQLEGYNTLKITQSARGVSLLCLAFSGVATALAAVFHVTPLITLVDAIVLTALGVCIYRGMKWASIIAMVVWTFERVMAIAGLPDNDTAMGPVIGSFFWWAAFMRPFWISFKVEQERRKLLQTNQAQNIQASDKF